jgi:hypothetical protein
LKQLKKVKKLQTNSSDDSHKMMFKHNGKLILVSVESRWDFVLWGLEIYHDKEPVFIMFKTDDESPFDILNLKCSLFKVLADRNLLRYLCS